MSNNNTNVSRFALNSTDTAPLPPPPAESFDWATTAMIAANAAVVVGTGYAIYRAVSALDRIAANTTTASPDDGDKK